MPTKNGNGTNQNDPKWGCNYEQWDHKTEHDENRTICRGTGHHFEGFRLMKRISSKGPRRTKEGSKLAPFQQAHPLVNPQLHTWQPSNLHLHFFATNISSIWVNYNISLTWIKAIWEWFPYCFPCEPSFQWGLPSVCQAPFPAEVAGQPGRLTWDNCEKNLRGFLVVFSADFWSPKATISTMDMMIYDWFMSFMVLYGVL